MFHSLELEKGSRLVHQSHTNRIDSLSLDNSMRMARNNDILDQYPEKFKKPLVTKYQIAKTPYMQGSGSYRTKSSITTRISIDSSSILCGNQLLAKQTRVWYKNIQQQ
ncbi:hypothetical protein PSHT_13648 [Puccinia striiformis]|uniref:Uncharacterized protein n=2 Tax=Puccinia striiformis TaxID=27350 RepID=A0A2S4VB50_9BASI|nr:hypothetical protein PSHT_13648 [Puccinia striiformis]POW06766.1 hypothetical protein PSTT_08727 [Puccinia striiformis]